MADRTHAPRWLSAAAPAAAAVVKRFRACDLCEHGATRAGQRQCARPAAAPEPIERARSSLGSCGPEARFLDVPAWHA